MTNHNPGVSSHSTEEWEKIRRLFVKLYVEHGLSLTDTQRHLEVRLGFTASESEYKKRIGKKWPECSKNGKGTSGTAGTAGRTRSKKAGQNPDYPAYAQLNPRPKGPITIDDDTNLDDNITLVLKCIGRYSQAFYDSNSSQATSVEEVELDAGWKKWHHALTLCQEISLFPQKKKGIIFDEGNSKTAKENGRVEMKDIVTRLVQDHVFTLLDGIEVVTTPRNLPTFWAICRILHGLSCQLGHTEGLESLLTRDFVQTLRGLFSNVHEGPTTMLYQAFGHLLQMPPFEMREITRTTRGVTKTKTEPVSKISELTGIGSHYSARLLSSRLSPYDPVVLQAWADQYQHWDRTIIDKGTFLCHYDVAYGRSKVQSKKKCGWAFSEKTLAILTQYCHTAHYIFHDINLAQVLSTELWDHTGATKEWSVHVQGMVEAAKIQALLDYINHEDKLKARGELKNKKREHHLWFKRGRRTYRKQVLRSRQQDYQLGDMPPYQSEQQSKFGLQEVVQQMINQDDESYLLFVADLHHLLQSLQNTDINAMSNLIAAAEMMDSSEDRECHLLAAALYDLLASLTQAGAQDIGTLRISAQWLKQKVKDDSGGTEICWDNLTGFFEEEEERKNIKGKKFRDEAAFHRLAIAYASRGVEEEN